MASIERRGTERAPQYVVRWREPGGKSRQQTFTRKRDAERQRDAVSQDKRSGAYVDRSEGMLAYGEWATEWLATRLDLRPSTRATYESVLRARVLPTFQAVPLIAIEQPQVQAWIGRLADAGLSAATIVKAYTLFAASLGAAVQAKRLRVTPCVGIKLPKVERDEMQFLDSYQVAALAEAMPERYRALVLLSAYSGLRIGEVTALRRSRLDLLRGRVRVEATAVEVRGEWTENLPKTRAGRRTVPIPRAVTDALSEHVERFAEDGPDGLVFTAELGGPLRVTNWRSRVWAPAVARAGLSPAPRIHDLRHTAVALWIATGASPLQVKQLAGHERSTFTLDRYGHLYADAHDELMAALDAHLKTSRAADVVELAPRLAR